MTNRHTYIDVKSITPIELCGKTRIWRLDVSSAYEIPFQTNPTTGEHDYNTCEGCQKKHKQLLEHFNKLFYGEGQKQGFPYCCPYHSNLVNKNEFNRNSFVSAPQWTADKIIYTYQHITNCIKSDNYYKEITDYIEYTIESFGKMPNGCGEPLYASNYFDRITHFLESDFEGSNERKNNLLSYLEKLKTPPQQYEKADFNILIATYEKWLKIFPFELESYFGNLKQHFENQLPIFNGKPERNTYLGTNKFKLHTKASLIEALISLTNSLLTKFNGLTLYEKGLFNDANKLKLELIISSRKLKLKQGYTNDSQDEETRYRRILKEWFVDEKKFISDITPLIKALAQPATQHLPELTGKLITFNNSETIDKFHTLLKGFFTNKETELLKALNGEKLAELLLFPHNQNKLVEVFKRAKYNHFIVSSPTELSNWLCSNFAFRYKKGGKTENRAFNKSTVLEILTKGKGEPKKEERIGVCDWLPYKSHLQRRRGSQNA